MFFGRREREVIVLHDRAVGSQLGYLLLDGPVALTGVPVTGDPRRAQADRQNDDYETDSECVFSMLEKECSYGLRGTFGVSSEIPRLRIIYFAHFISPFPCLKRQFRKYPFLSTSVHCDTGLTVFR